MTLTSNRWCQIALTYTTGALALYTNGVPCVTNTASFAYPGLEVRMNGFAVGCALAGGGVANGVFEDLETFNYPLSTNDVFENFQLTQPPQLIPNLRMWLKADYGTATNSSGEVQTWLDGSGNGNDARQDDLNTRPTWVGSGIGGKPAIEFPGDRYFTLPNNLFGGASEAEAFVLLKAESDTPTNGRGLWAMGATLNNYYPKPDGTIVDSFCSDGFNSGIPSVSLETPHIYGVLSKTNEWTSRINGVIHFSKRANAAQFRTNSIRLGNGFGGSFAGHIGEALIYARALNAEERFAVERYLSQRYELTTYVPPASCTLAAFGVSTNQVSLTWNGSLSNTNLDFVVQRRSSTTSFSNIVILRNALSFLDSGLSANTTYYYRVKAVNYAGASAYSPEAGVTTLASGVRIPLEALRVWLKADCGHGGSPVNCWADQTTNNNSPYYEEGVTPRRPSWSTTAMNGRPAMSFLITNGFSMFKFATGWTQAEAFAVLKSLGSTSNNYSCLWLMSPPALAGWYPDDHGHIYENFGCTNGTLDTGVPLGGLFDLSAPHLYNVAAAPNFLASFLNNSQHYSTNVNGFGLADHPRLGWGANSNRFNGYISEIMFFNRILDSAERDALATNYFKQRYGLW